MQHARHPRMAVQARVASADALPWQLSRPIRPNSLFSPLLLAPFSSPACYNLATMSHSLDHQVNIPILMDLKLDMPHTISAGRIAAFQAERRFSVRCITGSYPAFDVCPKYAHSLLWFLSMFLCTLYVMGISLCVAPPLLRALRHPTHTLQV